MPEGPVGAPPQNLKKRSSRSSAPSCSRTPRSRRSSSTSACTPEDFYRESHGRIYQAMLELHSKGEPIDVLTVIEHSSRPATSRGSAARPRSRCAGSVPAVGNVRQYARIVRETRCCAGCCTPPTRSRPRFTVTRPAARTRRQAERLILEVAQEDSRKDFRSIEQVLDFELDKLQKLSLEGTPITGTPSGFEDLDNITGGFQPGNLIILAARPSMGKSALMANIAENAALQSKKAVALFSLEMSEVELAQRFIASQASIKGDDLRKGRVPPARWGKILQASSRLAESSSTSTTRRTCPCSISAPRPAARAAERGRPRPGPDRLPAVDARGRHRRGPENRVEQIGQISRGLKTLARELEVPVIALSQLNRGVEQRKPPIPML